MEWHREQKAVYCSNDLGTQQGLLLSPDLIREFLVPEYRRLFTLYRERGVIINFHSCGHIEPLLETFIELGIDCLNPVQVDAIREEVRLRLRQLGSGGGYFCAPDQGMPWPEAHSLAYGEALEEFGPLARRRMPFSRIRADKA